MSSGVRYLPVIVDGARCVVVMTNGGPRMERHLSPADLAERLGVPLATVYSWNSTGTGPRYFRAGRHVRYRLGDVERWEREQERDHATVR
jgi:excisionase family DNA binding protein